MCRRREKGDFGGTPAENASEHARTLAQQDNPSKIEVDFDNCADQCLRTCASCRDLGALPDSMERHDDG